ncbi:hypothetical protein [Myceligenerans crystallogenes]|uniref:MinD-like ATPase involved in chromosome partitioning or flagellar assembly n=1 Tax=Myceligenerans crystallogenes TaxID=316335 RepID=A0ABP4ZM29_9MICO
MALVALANAKGSPGTTTTALVLAISWPRPVLLVEADLAGGSILAGYFRGQLAHDRGLGKLAIAHNHGELETSLWDQTLTLVQHNQDKKLLPGIVSPHLAPSVANLWGALANQLVAMERGGMDVLVDLGRMSPGGRDDREPLIRLADQVLVTTGSRLPDIAVTRELVKSRTSAVEAAARDLTNLTALTIGPGRPYDAREIARTLGLGSAGSIAWDPPGAEVLSVGSPSGRKWTSSALVRSAGPVITAIQERTAARRERFSTGAPAGGTGRPGPGQQPGAAAPGRVGASGGRR